MTVSDTPTKADIEEARPVICRDCRNVLALWQNRAWERDGKDGYREHACRRKE